MERLTTKFNDGYLFNLPSGKDEKAQNEYVDLLSRKLGELEDLEEQGLLIRLPVAEGSTVYKLGYIYECEFDYDDCPMIPSYICEECEKCEHEHKNYRVEETKFKQQLIAVLGKTVFLTKEEAEAALAEMG